jgi:hypothetical protein
VYTGPKHKKSDDSELEGDDDSELEEDDSELEEDSLPVFTSKGPALTTVYLTGLFADLRLHSTTLSSQVPPFF